MSYGFFRLPHGSTSQQYAEKVLGSPVIVSVQERGPVERKPEPPSVAATELGDERAKGFTGNTCDICQGAHMIRAGHCEVCTDCGTTTGCS